jgi:pimeloyl-ACP methyl ester carboxylesterase
MKQGWPSTDRDAHPVGLLKRSPGIAQECGPSGSRSKETSTSMCHQSQLGSSSAWNDVPTRSVDVGGTKFVYRQLGPDTGVPVIFLNHLAAELDRWDPRVVDGIAARHRVIAFDNRGIGASEGSPPNSVAAMARDAVAFIRALGLEQVDLLGFSLGGFISQVIALEEPELVRKIILVGTGPAGGTGIDKDVGDHPRLDKSRAHVQASGILSLLHQDPQWPQGGTRISGTAERGRGKSRQAGFDRRLHHTVEGHTCLGTSGSCRSLEHSPFGAGGEWRSGQDGTQHQLG